MAKYRYRATDDRGRPTAGELEAADADAARQLLALQGLVVTALEPVAGAAGGARLTSDEAGQLADHLARAGAAQLPLVEGLRAAAAECGNRRIEAALLVMAAQLETGRSLADVVADERVPLPPHLSGLVAAAARTGKIGLALSELLEHQRAARRLRRAVLQSFAYPMVVVVLTGVVVLLVLFGLAGTYEQMFEEFELDLPYLTELVFWWRNVGIWVAAGVLAAVCLAALAARQVMGAARWQGLLASVPVLGPLLFWSGVAEWSSLLSVLLKHQLPLPEALRLSAAGVGNAYVSELAHELAEDARGGQKLSQSLAGQRRLPRSMLPIVKWGEKVDLLSEAFAATHDLFDRRVRIRAIMLRAVLPPMLFIGIGCTVGGLVGALFLPMITLVQGLS